MAIAFVQQKENTTTAATSIAATFTGNTTSGNLIVVAVGHDQAASKGVISVSDGTNTYIQLVPAATTTTPGGTNFEIWYAKNITGGVTPTVTATLTSSYVAHICVVEASGLDITQPVDYIGKRHTTGIAATTVYSTVTPELKAANEFIFIFNVNNTNSGTYTALGSLTNLQQQSNAAGGSSASATQIVSAQTSQNLATSFNGNSSGVIAVVTFADQTMPPPYYQTTNNNFQFVKTGNGMSATEKIR